MFWGPDEKESETKLISNMKKKNLQKSNLAEIEIYRTHNRIAETTQTNTILPTFKTQTINE